DQTRRSPYGTSPSRRSRLPREHFLLLRHALAALQTDPNQRI
ncbi:unnamed protein product, partial [Linum tenue]